MTGAPSPLTALRARAAFPPPDPDLPRLVADQALSRAAGAPLVPGNAVRLLRDAAENYPAWLDAIAAARHRIHFESYIIHDDAWGRRFREALADAARRGVRVRLLYDWLGALGATRRAFWRPLVEAGAEVRCFNPPRFDRPLGWLARDHRKALVVDGAVAFVSGLCVGQAWAGDPARGVEPWRDTGVEVRGPAVADVEGAFGRAWAAAGAPLPDDERPGAEETAPAGEVALRVIASEPRTAGLLRLDQLIAGIARETLWLTDAYFVGLTSYVQAIVAAARDGVDVRLLVPGAGDIPWLRPLSRAGYRPLLEAGVRVFEWNGPMLHAKCAVADARWARVGSSNLNIASWLGNWELDVAVEDAAFAGEMEAMYLEDLARSTEIVLDARNRVQPTTPRERRRRPRLVVSSGGGSAGRATAGALRIGNTVGAALTARRVLGPAEARVMLGAGLLLLLLGTAAALRPGLVAYPIAALAAWGAVSLLVRGVKLKRGSGVGDRGSGAPRASTPTPDP